MSNKEEPIVILPDVDEISVDVFPDGVSIRQTARSGDPDQSVFVPFDYLNQFITSLMRVEGRVRGSK